MAYSRASFLETIAFVKQMDGTKPETVEMQALIEATFIAYNRPFKKCQIAPGRYIAPLKQIPPPPRLAEFHEDALEARDRMIGHKDATASKRYTATPNIVTVTIVSGNFDIGTFGRFAEMESPMRNALRELCDYFVDHCEQEVSLWKKAYGCDVMEKGQGKYELVISEPPAEWLVPFRVKHGADFKAHS